MDFYVKQSTVSILKKKKNLQYHIGNIFPYIRDKQLL